MDEQQMMLRTEDLVKKYRTRTVVNHVSINVKQGEIVGLLGPNGAGKTTTFYMSVGLVTPNQGKIFLDDTEITGYPVYKRARLGKPDRGVRSSEGTQESGRPLVGR